MTTERLTYRSRQTVEAVQFLGGKIQADEIIEWVSSLGGSGSYLPGSSGTGSAAMPARLERLRVGRTNPSAVTPAERARSIRYDIEKGDWLVVSGRSFIKVDGIEFLAKYELVQPAAKSVDQQITAAAKAAAEHLVPIDEEADEGDGRPVLTVEAIERAQRLQRFAAQTMPVIDAALLARVHVGEPFTIAPYDPSPPVETTGPGAADRTFNEPVQGSAVSPLGDLPGLKYPTLAVDYSAPLDGSDQGIPDRDDQEGGDQEQGATDDDSVNEVDDSEHEEDDGEDQEEKAHVVPVPVPSHIETVGALDPNQQEAFTAHGISPESAAVLLDPTNAFIVSELGLADNNEPGFSFRPDGLSGDPDDTEVEG